MQAMSTSLQHSRTRSSENEADSSEDPHLARRKRINVGATYRKRRAIVACDVCRARRTKCDGQKPACSFCKENGGDCTYQPVREAPPSKLETEISAVREQLNLIQSVLVRAPALTPNASLGSPEATGGSPSTRIPVMILSDSDFMEVVGIRGDLADEVISRERMHCVPTNQYRGGRTLVIQQHHALTALSDYHDKVHVWFPYLHPSFKERFLSIVSGSLCPSAESCLALMVIATGCITQHCGTLSYRSLPDTNYAAAALEMLPLVLGECSTMSVQCLIAIAFYYNSLLKPIQAHDYIMIASLRIQTLLKRRNHTLSPDELELIHRSYWAILLLEAELANPLDLPSSGIRGLSEQIQLPSSFQSSHLRHHEFAPAPSSELVPQALARQDASSAESYYGDGRSNSGISLRYNSEFSMSPLHMHSIEGTRHRGLLSDQNGPASSEVVDSYYLAEIAMRRMLFRCTTSTRLQQASNASTYAPIVAAELVYQLDEWYYHLPTWLRFDRFTDHPNSGTPTETSIHPEFLRTQYYSCLTGIYWPAAYEAIRDGNLTGHIGAAVGMFLDSYAGFMKSAVESVHLCEPNQWIVHVAIFCMTVAAHKTVSTPHLRSRGSPNLEYCFESARRAFKGIESRSPSLDYLAELLDEKLGTAGD